MNQDQPARSPAVDSEPAPYEGETSARPIGVSLLALWLIVIGSTKLLFAVATSLPLAQGAVRGSSNGGTYLAWLFVTSSITLIAGIGLWRGAKWGWWLAAFGFANSAFTGGILLFQGTPHSGNESAAFAAGYGLNAVIRFIGNGLLLAFCFRSMVWNYMNMAAVKKGIALTAVLLAAAIFAAVEAYLLTSR